MNKVKTKDTDDQNSQINSRKSQNEQLKTELQCERNKSDLVIAQLESALKNEETMHKQTKDELHHSIKTCASELEFATNRLDKNNDKIHMLETSVQQLSKKN